LHRIFLIKIDEFTFEKKDLNIPFTEKRRNIGTLSGIITNAIFLSHSLRENVIVRLLIKKPMQHIIQIQTDKIRYLGPEERSLASIILKAERKILENYDTSFRDKWFQPNPGLFACITDNWYFDLDQYISEPIGIIQFTETDNTNKEFSAIQFEQIILASREKNNSSIYFFDLTCSDKELELQPLNLKSVLHQEKIAKVPSLPKLIGLINIILDKKEKE